MKVYTSELLNLSVEIMNSIVEDIIELLQRHVKFIIAIQKGFLISSSCFFKMLSSIFLILIKVACRVQIWKKHFDKIVAEAATGGVL